VRNPAVAGQFYAHEKGLLEREIRGYVEKAGQKELADLKAIVAPHAGYMYSGQTAAYSYSAIPRSFKGTFVIAGPNHTGMGEALSISTDDWRTPMGTAECDKELASAIASESSAIVKSEVAHTSEHSLEVQLPFLQFLFPQVSFVAICMGDQRTPAAFEVARAVRGAAGKLKREIIFIASSDFTHQEPAESAKKKDGEALELIKELDAEKFQKLVLSKNLSICGHGPIAAAIAYSKAMGAKEGRLLNYSNSGVASGDYRSVVAYAGIAFL